MRGGLKANEAIPAGSPRSLRSLATTCNIIHLKSVGSTNSYALKLAEKGASHGTVVWADEQTEGRGQFDRKWVSEPGNDLLASIIVRPKLSAKEASKITLQAAEIIRECLNKTYGIKGSDLIVKAPNDLILQGKKVCGILTESSSKGKNLEYAVIGIGINLNSNPNENVPNSTSFNRELSRKIEIYEVLLSISESIVKNIA